MSDASNTAAESITNKATGKPITFASTALLHPLLTHRSSAASQSSSGQPKVQSSAPKVQSSKPKVKSTTLVAQSSFVQPAQKIQSVSPKVQSAAVVVQSSSSTAVSPTEASSSPSTSPQVVQSVPYVPEVPPLKSMVKPACAAEHFESRVSHQHQHVGEAPPARELEQAVGEATQNVLELPQDDAPLPSMVPSAAPTYEPTIQSSPMPAQASCTKLQMIVADELQKQLAAYTAKQPIPVKRPVPVQSTQRSMQQPQIPTPVSQRDFQNRQNPIVCRAPRIVIKPSITLSANSKGGQFIVRVTRSTPRQFSGQQN